MYLDLLKNEIGNLKDQIQSYEKFSSHFTQATKLRIEAFQDNCEFLTEPKKNPKNVDLTTTLEIGSDDAFTNIIHTEDTSLEQLSYTFTSTGTFYWRVVANDEAGNNGSYSAVHEITIQ